MAGQSALLSRSEVASKIKSIECNTQHSGKSGSKKSKKMEKK